MGFARLRKLSEIAVRPGLWPALACGVAATVEHDVALGAYQFATVIDVGANKGQFAAYARWRWPKARLICFEPLPEPRARLVRVTRGKAEVFDCALGESEGEATLHVASRADSSSLLPLGARQKSLFHMDEVGTLRVPVRRLDACVAAPLAPPVMLKIDVQGFELEVLKGATALLPAIDAVYVEVSYEPLYEGQALAGEVALFLTEAGLTPIATVNDTTSNNQVVQADVLFGR